MFIGHFGVALAAKKVAPETSLGTLILAAQFLDFLWPLFLLLGIEHVRIAPGITRVSPLDFTDYPISHSLLMATLWAVVFAGIYYTLRRNAESALVVGAAVLSHWVLDFIVHRPDLQLYPGSVARVGLGLWNSWSATVAAEVLCFSVGLWIYLSCTRARDNSGRYGFWALIAFLFFGWVSTLFAGAPPNVTSLAWGGIAMWLTAPWAWWADRHRAVVPSA
jgi:LexA-binding, inner membrane-associated putative hydrolase